MGYQTPCFITFGLPHLIRECWTCATDGRNRTTKAMHDILHFTNGFYEFLMRSCRRFERSVGAQTLFGKRRGSDEIRG